MNEFQLIKKYFDPLTNNSKAAQNLNDDAARLSIKSNEELIISKDLMVEDVHFLLQDGGFKIAAKLLLTNLSDIAASGAKPLCYMLGFSKNNNLNENFYKEFSKGLQSIQNKFKIFLIGGDTVYSNKLVFSITIFGTIKKGESLNRSKAKAGDLIFVTNNIGEAFLGRTNPDKYSQEHHFFPQPRVDFCLGLVKNKLSKCAIDISDGLLADLNHICQASKLSAEIQYEKIPISESAKEFLKNNSSVKTLDLFSGGDDYEIIFSCKAKDKNKILKLAEKFNLKISEIGFFKKDIAKKFKVELLKKNKQKVNIKKFGYEH